MDTSSICYFLIVIAGQREGKNLTVIIVLNRRVEGEDWTVIIVDLGVTPPTDDLVIVVIDSGGVTVQVNCASLQKKHDKRFDNFCKKPKKGHGDDEGDDD